MTNTAAKPSTKPTTPTPSQRAWLARGLDQAGGKLPLFDLNGRKVSPRTVRTCMDHGWVAPWFMNPTKPDWIVCRLTDQGRKLAETT
ncbi:MAG: hypothetical protein HOF95_07530 [Rhodospirillales bacterium]|jgi:hypothetical protein|nr:hypothetical protein [Rhodospirillales bacterium]MBT4007120.1 hypothetical protein [Rhodospirillales bacterium]MBT5076932.1 hypothetical protein [Rhodospirillales bacterium]MBT5113453.1 hypothetical protein [Rhodospirillales bacterium]MBT5673751.1 hypothetical protein [Rhodospirillales bacterium]